MEGEAPATATRLRGALRIALAGVLGLALLVAALAIGIDTGPGHRLIVRQIAALNFANGMRVSVGRIEIVDQGADLYLFATDEPGVYQVQAEGPAGMVYGDAPTTVL